MELPCVCPVNVKYTCDTFLIAESLSVSAIHKWLQNMYGVNMMLECTIHLWVHRCNKEKWETFTTMKEMVNQVIIQLIK